MNIKKIAIAAVGAAVLATPLLATPAAAQDDTQFVPLLVYRTGPYAPNGIPLADGFNDYFQLINTCLLYTSPSPRDS